MSGATTHNIIERFFPPPRFLQMHSVGLDITDHRARFLEIKSTRRGLVASRYGEIKIPNGVIVGGRIKSAQELKNILRNFANEHKLEFARVSLPEERTYLVKMDLPNVSATELRDAIMFQLEEYVPLPAKDAIFDYQVISSLDGSDSKKNVQVAVSVLPKDEVQEYADIFDGTGMRAISFEIVAQAVARAVIPQKDKGTYMVLDFGGDRTGIFIVSDGVVRFTSTIGVGSDMITSALCKQFSIDVEKAEQMKNERIITRRAIDDVFFQAVMSSVSILRDEINKLFIYWHTKYEAGDAGKIEKIYMTGGGSNLKGLAGYLSVSLNVPVARANPWVNVNSFEKYIPELQYARALGYTSAIGLALNGQLADDNYRL